MDLQRRIDMSAATGLTDIAKGLDFRGQTVVITGAGAGIGQATAKMLHQFGAHIIAVDIQKHGLKDLFDQCNGTRISTIEFDLSGPDESYLALAQEIINNSPSGKIDSFMITAGAVKLSANTGLQNLAAWERDKLIRINATSNHEIYRNLSGHFSDNARIVFASSPIAGRADPVTPGYAISKSLLESIMNQMFAEIQGTNITVTGWVPPPVQNFLRADLKPDEALHAHPHGEDVAELAARLASPTINHRFNGQVVEMAYDHLRLKDGKNDRGKTFDYMPRAKDNGFLYDLRLRPIAQNGGSNGKFIGQWSTQSSRDLQGLGPTPAMDKAKALKDIYKAPEHIAAHRGPELN